MAPLTIDLDPQTREEVERAARAAGVSVSRWVRERLEEALHHPRRWPPGYFNLFGSLRHDPSFEEPPELPYADDAARDRL